MSCVLIPPPELQIVQTNAHQDNSYIGDVAVGDGFIVMGSQFHGYDQNEENFISNAGAIWIKYKYDTYWGSERKIVSPNRGSGGFFGAHVEVAGDWIFVSAPKEDERGRIYIININTPHLIYTISGSTGHYLGFSLSVSADGTVIAAGSPWSDQFAGNNGSIAIYTWDGTSATLQSTIVGTAAQQYLGYTVKLNPAGTLLAAASASQATPYHVDWYSLAVITSPAQVGGSMAGAGSDYFGSAPGQDNGQFANFGMTPLEWDQDGDLIIGAYGDDVSGLNTGRVYIYDTPEAQPSVIEEPTSMDYTFFGASLAVYGDYLIIGAQEYDSSSDNDIGAYHFYQKISGTYTFLATVTAKVPVEKSFFGFRLRIDDNFVYIVASDYDGDGTDQGAVYICRYIGRLCISATDVEVQKVRDYQIEDMEVRSPMNQNRIKRKK